MIPMSNVMTVFSGRLVKGNNTTMRLNLFKRCYQKIYIFIMRAKSYIESRLIRLRVSKISFSDVIQGKVVILMPHSDDEWIGCSRIIVGQNEKVMIANMDMMGGDAANIHHMRRQEMLSVANRYNSDVVLISGKKSDKIEELSVLIKGIKPDYVCVPFYYDWHSEHLETREILYEALKLLRSGSDLQSCNRLSVIEYQVSVPIPARYITHCMKMTREDQSEKWELFHMTYKTQAFFPMWRFKDNEYISGKLCGAYACENFVCSTANLWMSSFANNIISEQQRIKIMKHFRDIAKIRATIDAFDRKKFHFSKYNLK